MKSTHLALVAAFLAASCVSPARAATVADLVGTWSLVSLETTRPDGTKVGTYGAHPKGLLMFDRDGHFTFTVVDTDRPKFASNNRLTGTAQENQAAFQGSTASFGRYAVDADGKVITFQLEASTFANWNEDVQKRPFTVSGDDLRFSNAPGSPAGVILHVLKRLK